MWILFLQTFIPQYIWEKGLPLGLLAVAVVWIAMEYQRERKNFTEKLFGLQEETVKCVTNCTNAMDKMADSYKSQNEMLETKLDSKFQQNREEMQKIVNELGYKLTEKMNEKAMRS